LRLYLKASFRQAGRASLIPANRLYSPFMDHSPANIAAILAVAILSILLLWQLAWLVVRLAARALRLLAARLPSSRVWARMHPLRAALAQRFPRTYAWFDRRLHPRRFTGLPLTLMVTAALYLASLIGGLIEELIEADQIIVFDSIVDALIDPYRRPLLIRIFSWITDLGGSAALLAVIMVATGFLWAYRRPHYILPLWVTNLGAHTFTWLGKFGFDRERPEFVTSVTALSPSFPSAHATGAMAVYGFMAYIIARDLQGPRERFEITFWTTVLIALIGFSRIFLSVHYTSDVVTGFLVGGFWLLVGFAIAEYGRQREVAFSASR